MSASSKTAILFIFFFPSIILADVRRSWRVLVKAVTAPAVPQPGPYGPGISHGEVS